MGKHEKGLGEKGSLKWLQILINKNPNLFNEQIYKELGLKEDPQIMWLSPMEREKYCEYSDLDFLEKLGLSDMGQELKKFWPMGGPNWDAFGKGNRDKTFLVEAKAHIGELFSSPSSAKAESSRELISLSLERTKAFLGSNSTFDWSQLFYQYCNRLAHLYFFRGIVKKETYLIFLYFIGDWEMAGPNSKEEWFAALKVLKYCLGLSEKHPLSGYIAEVFIDVDKLMSA